MNDNNKEKLEKLSVFLNKMNDIKNYLDNNCDILNFTDKDEFLNKNVFYLKKFDTQLNESINTFTELKNKYETDIIH